MTNDFCPKVSIIIPVYNGANYMREAIDSALAQTYENIEVIVVNDGSNDNGQSRSIALSYGDKIRYFEKENGGVSSALNIGIREMTGEYFSWLSHDDKYEVDKVQNSVAYLSCFNERDNCVVMCGAYYINEKSIKIKDVPKRFEKDRVYTGTEIIGSILLDGMLNCCCMLIPKKAFFEFGMFHEGLRYNQDALILYQIFGSGYNMVACHDSRDVMYRLHSQQTSKLRKDLLLKDSKELAKVIGKKFSSLYIGRRNMLFLLARKNAIGGCFGAVDECIHIGKEEHVIGLGDRFSLLFWSIVGRLRSLAKTIYYKIRFR